MGFATRIDEYGKAAWIAAVILGFWFAWPVGAAVLAFVALSGRMRAWRHDGPGRWHDAKRDGVRGTGLFRDGLFRPGMFRGGLFRDGAPSGNAAFDAYRTDTLRRLEEEQREFVEYLDRLRQARDKAEFDSFMAERQRRTPTAPTQD